MHGADLLLLEERQMTINEKAEYAAALKAQGRCNCCQAVTAVLADETKLSPETLMQLASGFAVGMGTMENTCGALIGAAMIAGLKMQGEGTVRCTRQLTERFKEKCGAIVCKDLKGIGTGKMLCPCDECVKNAVLAYGEVMR